MLPKESQFLLFTKLPFCYPKKVLNSVKPQNRSICVEKIKNSLLCPDFNFN